MKVTSKHCIFRKKSSLMYSQELLCKNFNIVNWREHFIITTCSQLNWASGISVWIIFSFWSKLKLVQAQWWSKCKTTNKRGSGFACGAYKFHALLKICFAPLSTLVEYDTNWSLVSLAQLHLIQNSTSIYTAEEEETICNSRNIHSSYWCACFLPNC